jgi:hypothetical protein
MQDYTTARNAADFTRHGTWTTIMMNYYGRTDWNKSTMSSAFLHFDTNVFVYRMNQLCTTPFFFSPKFYSVFYF